MRPESRRQQDPVSDMDKSDQKHKPVASVTILQHIGCETPGIISDCLQLAGIDMRLVRIFDENPVPSVYTNTSAFRFYSKNSA